jgi:uncharacterized protein YbaP (TraB family)
MRVQDKQELIMRSTKGYLFVIRDNDKNVLGYLYGTVHQLNVKDIFQIDPQILQRFDKCSHLYLEMDIFPDWNETIADFIKEQPVAVEHFFYSRAKSQGKEVKGLETAESRQAATHAISKKHENTYLIKEKAENYLVYTFCMMLQKYKELASSLNAEITADTLLTLFDEKVSGLIDIIVEIIKHQKYLKPLERKYPGFYFMPKLVAIIDNISQLLATGLVPETQVNLLKHALVGQLARDKEAKEKSLANIQNRFIEGNTDFEIADLHSAASSLLDEKVQSEQTQTAIEHTQIRDLDMVESLDKDLRETQLSQSERCGFYAVGSFHLIAKYEPNLITLLRQRGWDVVPVNLNTISLNEQSFFACPINDEKEGSQQYKPENLIQVRQYLSNIF